MKADSHNIKIGISIGDPNGVSSEVIYKTFSNSKMIELCTPIIYGSTKILSFYKNKLEVDNINFNIINDASASKVQKVNIKNCWEDEFKIEPGKPSKVAGKYALKALDAALEDLKSGKIDALVTGPVDKSSINTDEFKFTGHTEYIAEKFDSPNKDLMLMVKNNLRVGVVTSHIPLSEVSKSITQELIFKKLKILNESLKKDFAIDKPLIAVLGLNPHSGDDGLLGTEEKEVINPAIEKAKENNLNVFGPFPADGFFGSSNYQKFDGILAMYHDQGLVPFKTLVESTGVNYTAGLPVIRTSPDHGTGYSIVGKNLASEVSFREAIYLAIDVTRSRKQYIKLTKNSIK